MPNFHEDNYIIHPVSSHDLRERQLGYQNKSKPSNDPSVIALRLLIILNPKNVKLINDRIRKQIKAIGYIYEPEVRILIFDILVGDYFEVESYVNQKNPDHRRHNHELDNFLQLPNPGSITNLRILNIVLSYCPSNLSNAYLMTTAYKPTREKPALEALIAQIKLILEEKYLNTQEN